MIILDSEVGNYITSCIHLELEMQLIGRMLETRLGLGCSVHMAAGLGTFDFIDLDPHIDPENEPFMGGPEFTAPFYSLSNVQGGIGVQKR